MKIYTREIMERTGFKKYPYKQVFQFIVYDDNNKIIFTNFDGDIEKVKKPFTELKDISNLSKFRDGEKELRAFIVKQTEGQKNDKQ